MIIRRPPPVPSSEITPESVYLNRRAFFARAGQAAAAAAFAPAALAGAEPPASEESREAQEALTPFEDVTNYNNFYEFGTDKRDPARNSGDFRPRPWSVTIDGHCERPGTYGLEDLVPARDVEERVYRLRCVEAWSMVIPWNGVPLRKVLDRVQPTSRAQYVAFETVLRPSEMPAQRTRILDWPYVEGLRMDEAWHDLTLLSTGLYGRDLLNQNGAPLRLVVPWKYGFKSIKSIVRISFVEAMPPTTWNLMAPHEYGFFANVNPTVDHPRWSQARERRITGARLFSPGWFESLRQRPTEMFNGYAEQVAHLYAGMDLRRWY
jgi:methionine sulfoxide reductase catalytic subunit